ncbi:protein EMP47 [Naviculisporaceae sp. PSN 640]
MRHFLSAAALVASVAQTNAQFLVNDLSFGYGVRIAPEGQNSIPNFSLSGNPGHPELLSNKVILTPLMPGNQRGAVWADRTNQHQNWITDVEFRASGPERAGGNLNIWLAKDGPHVVGTSSLYTVRKFEGLVLVVDQYGGSSGMIRGFLNDGNTDYSVHHNVDGLAFGHCVFPYRNLGRPAQIKLRQTDAKFSVEVDSHLCFESDKIRIPTGYNFGITAASADSPDSFEVFKLVVLTEENHSHSSSGHEGASGGYAQAHDPPKNNNNQQQQQHYGRSGQAASNQVPDDPYDNKIPDEDADKITSSKAQFADLHNRLQSVNHHLSTIFRQQAQYQSVGEQRHEELSIMIGELKGLLTKLDTLSSIESKIQALENDIRSVRRDVWNKVQDSENAVKNHLTDQHADLHEHVEEKLKKHVRGGHTKLILFIILGQAILAGTYVWYKRRRSMPKKYL